MISNIILISLFLSSIVYVILSFIAYTDLADETKNTNKISFAASPIWPFFPKAYNEIGKGLCKSGKILFWYLMVGGTIWLILERQSNFA
jgi:hypothetical protein